MTGDRDPLTDHANHREYVGGCEPCLERLNAIHEAQDHFNKHDIDGLCDWITHHVDSDGAFEYGFYAGERWATARVRAAQAQALRDAANDNFLQLRTEGFIQFEQNPTPQRVQAWLRDRAKALDAGDEFQNP